VPKGTRVYRCVQKLMAEGDDKPTAIRKCQASTRQSYMTGRSLKRKRKRRK